MRTKKYELKKLYEDLARFTLHARQYRLQNKKCTFKLFTTINKEN